MKNSKYLKMFDPELAQKLMLEGKNQEEIGTIFKRCVWRSLSENVYTNFPRFA